MEKVGGTFLQAESEIAAINMVYEAAAAGARVMTSSSSPGISLKGEGISYMAGADLPGVIINVQRGGPGLGGIQPSQADYWQATRALGHGDFRVVVYAPSTVQEMADYVYNAFDVADKYRTPVMILADGMLGQMMEPVVMPEPVDSLPEKPWAACGHKHQRPHNVVNSLYLTAEALENLNVERYERYAAIERDEQRAEAFMTDDADIVVVAFGASARVARSAVVAAREKGVKAGLVRPITLWPFPVDAIEATIPQAKAYLSVEMNMGQMVDDVRLTVAGRRPVDFYGQTGAPSRTPVEVLSGSHERSNRRIRERRGVGHGRQGNESRVRATPCAPARRHQLLSWVLPRHRQPSCGRVPRRAGRGRLHRGHRARRLHRHVLRLLRLRHDRGRARPCAGGGHRREARAARRRRVRLPGRRRPGVHRHGRDGSCGHARREHHRRIREQRYLRHDRRPMVPNEPAGTR